mmetsp:Transcript_9653/g.18374  ORF Transcript_9653/g.18374 Transcript_9653/m.18374 type:complete len:227 (-) Transcript_9653:153-833(-)
MDSTVLTRFVEFGLHTINVTLEPILKDHLSKFRGNNDGCQYTIEQYEVYKQFEARLASEIEAFVEKEGFESAVDCVETIRRLAEEDKERYAREMKQQMEQLDAFVKKAKEAEVKQQLKAEGQEFLDAGGEEKENTAMDQIPLMVFYQPQSVDELLNTMLELAEYEGFAKMMKVRAEQDELLLHLQSMLQKAFGAMGFSDSDDSDQSCTEKDEDIAVEDVEDDDDIA